MDRKNKDNWKIIFNEFEPEKESLREALCAVGNGYFVTRGAAPESCASEIHYPGTYMAGVYNVEATIGKNDFFVASAMPQKFFDEWIYCLQFRIIALFLADYFIDYFFDTDWYTSVFFDLKTAGNICKFNCRLVIVSGSEY